MRGPYEDPQAELHEQLIEILTKLAEDDAIEPEDLTLLCIGCGVRTSELSLEIA